MVKLVVGFVSVLTFASSLGVQQVPSTASSELALTGRLRVGINFGNALLATKDAIGVPGGIAVDTKGNVWITAAGIEPAPQVAGAGRGAAATAAAEAAEVGIAPGGAGRGAAGAAPGGAGRGAATPAPAVPADAHVLKFSRAGRYLMTIGTPGKMDGADSQTTLNRPAAVAYDAAANEIFVADSGNHRVVVFDADSGAHKRHWFAYGEKTAGAPAGPYDPNAPAAKSFRDVTCVEISNDGMVTRS